MITLNGVEVNLQASKFPDGTFSHTPIDKEGKSIDLLFDFKEKVKIMWRYHSEEELIFIEYVTRTLQHVNKSVDLIMPYVPNARMDRIHNEQEIFTLRYFSEKINNLNFENVFILDPHSDTSSRFLERVHVTNPFQIVDKLLYKIADEEVILFYPDKGAFDRYDRVFDRTSIYGVKSRDWDTGKILDYEIHGYDQVRNQNILIVDDISSKGTTFYFAAKALKKAGAKSVSLYVTHCEDTIYDGLLFNNEENLVKKVYTTDSILKNKKEKVSIFKLNDQLKGEWI